jgi:hypothetical protein
MTDLPSKETVFEVLSVCCGRRMFISSWDTYWPSCPGCGWACHIKPVTP